MADYVIDLLIAAGIIVCIYMTAWGLSAVLEWLES